MVTGCYTGSMRETHIHLSNYRRIDIKEHEIAPLVRVLTALLGHPDLVYSADDQDPTIWAGRVYADAPATYMVEPPVSDVQG